MSVCPRIRRWVSGGMACLAAVAMAAATLGTAEADLPSAAGTWRLSGAVTGGTSTGAYSGTLTVAAGGGVTAGSLTDEETGTATAVTGGALTALPDRSVGGQLTTAGCSRDVFGHLSSGNDLVVAGYRETCGATSATGTLVAVKDDGATVYAQADAAGSWHLAAVFLGGKSKGTIRAIFKLDALGALLAGGTVAGSTGVSLTIKSGSLPLQADGALGAGSLLTLTGGDTLTLTGGMHPGKKLMGGTVTLNSGGEKSYGAFVAMRPATAGVQADGAGIWNWLGTRTSASNPGWDLGRLQMDTTGLFSWNYLGSEDGKSASFLSIERLTIGSTGGLVGDLFFLGGGYDLFNSFLGTDKDLFVGLYAEDNGGVITPGMLVGLKRSAPEPQPCQPALPAALPLDTPTAGALAAGDCRSRLDGAVFGQSYSFTAVAGDVVSLTVTSPDFWPRLNLSGPGGGVVASVELGESSGALQLANLVLPESGVYLVEVGSLDPAATGSFTLTLSAGALPAGCGAATALTIPGTANGALAATDCASPFRRGASADVYTFTGTAGQMVSFGLAASNPFQPKLALRNSRGELLSTAEAGTGETATIDRYRLPASGDYTLLATSVGAGETGAYTLTTSTPASCKATTQLLYNGAGYGANLPPLSGTTCPSLLFPAYPAQRYTLTGRAGDVVQVDLMPGRGSAATMALAILKPDGGLLAFDQDYLETPGSRLRQVTLPVAGTYIVEAIATYLGSGNPAAGALYRITAAVTAAPGAPTIGGIAPASAGVGVPVTLSGANFGVAVGTVSFAQSGGGRVEGTITSWANTVVKVTVPVGAVSGTLTLTRGDGRSGSSYITIPSPALTSLTPTSGALGATISILGTDLGATTGTVTFTSAGGTVAATISSWANTVVKVPVPAGAITGNLTLTTADGKSAALSFTRLTPTITALSPASGAAGTTVTITGSNFGTAEGTVSFVDATLTALPATIVAGSWKNGSVKVTVPATAETGNLTLSTAEAPALTAGKLFTVPGGPTITALSPAGGAPGNPVAISGSRFGAVQGTGTVTFAKTGGTTAATVLSWANTVVKVTIPADAVTGDITILPSAGRPARKSFTVPDPTITALSPASGAAGTTVTITGSNFGTAEGTVSFVDATLTAWPATIVAGSWKNGSVKVTVPAPAEAGPITLTTAAGRTARKAFTVPGGPTIAALSPASAVPGANVTISGRGFGAAGTVTFAKTGGTTAATVLSWGSTAVKVTVPNDAVTGDVTLLPAAGRPARKAFTVPAPTLSSLSVSSGVVGTAVTITGTNFGGPAVAGGVSFAKSGGGTAAAAVTNWGNTAVKVTVPADAVTGLLTLTRIDGVSVSKAFTVPALGLTTLSPSSGAAGVPVTISGTNLGVVRGTGGVTFTTAGGGTAAAAVTSWGNTAVKVTVPATAVSGDLTLTRGDGATVTRPFSVPDPTVKSLSPASGAVGVVVTIGGTYFGATPGTVTFNGSAGVTVPTSWGNTAVKVTVPADAVSGPLTLTRADGLTATKAFTVPAPTLSALSPASGKAGAKVVISGANLGAVQGAAGKVVFGATEAAVTTWSSASVTVAVPAGLPAGTVNLVLTRGDGVTTAAKSFTVLP